MLSSFTSQFSFLSTFQTHSQNLLNLITKKQNQQKPTILIKNGTIVTLGSENQILKDHSLLISNGKIEKILKNSESSTLTSKIDKTIDAKNQLILPGFINAHMHFYSTLVRGLGKAAPSKNFYEVLENLWWRLDKKLTIEDSYISALIPLIDSIKHGTTTLIDHHASPFDITGSLPRIGEAVMESGLRASLCYELSDRDGKKIADEGIEENVNWIKFCQQNDNNYLKGLFGLHASFTISDETLEKAAKEGKKLNAGFHVHTAEGTTDQIITQKKYGKTVVQRLYDLDMLNEKSICAHAIDVNDQEIDLLKKTDTIVVHNPSSNMNNAVGVSNIVKFAEKGILMGLGTDAMTVNMLEEIRCGLWIQKLFQNDPSCGFMEMSNALTQNNRIIAQRQFGDIGIGEIKVGGVADVALFDYIPPTEFSTNTFLGHLIFGISQCCGANTTIADGEVLMENRKLLTIDEEKVMEKARGLAEKLWERF